MKALKNWPIKKNRKYAAGHNAKPLRAEDAGPSENTHEQAEKGHDDSSEEPNPAFHRVRQYRAQCRQVHAPKEIAENTASQCDAKYRVRSVSWMCHDDRSESTMLVRVVFKGISCFHPTSFAIFAEEMVGVWSVGR